MFDCYVVDSDLALLQEQVTPTSWWPTTAEGYFSCTCHIREGPILTVLHIHVTLGLRTQDDDILPSGIYCQFPGERRAMENHELIQKRHMPPLPMFQWLKQVQAKPSCLRKGQESVTCQIFQMVTHNQPQPQSTAGVVALGRTFYLSGPIPSSLEMISEKIQRIMEYENILCDKYKSYHYCYLVRKKHGKVGQGQLVED